MWQQTKNVYHLAVAILANVYFSFPARKLTVIGITGTDGKTTTTSLVYHILKTANKNVSLISTVAAYIGDSTEDTGFHVTNPSSFPLQKFLQMISQLGTRMEKKYLVLEVTSHGIDQNRIWGIPFAVAGLTNITHEHLDYHKTFRNYVVTKTKLLQRAKVAIINKDDPSYDAVYKKLTVTRGLKEKKKIITYGLHEGADITPSTFAFKTNFLGEYNLYNCLLAIAVCKELGISADTIKKGIASFSPPIGRAEIVYKSDFTVMIDFAHTPNSLEQLLSSLRPQVTGRLIHIFSSAGLRDKSKRPLMGKAASKYDDIIILTAEDPRSERIEDINMQIRSTISNFSSSIFNHDKEFQMAKGEKYLCEIPDRQKAIDAAISLAKKGDFVVITGKGHETSINYGKGEEKWSDAQAVKAALARQTSHK